MPLPTTRAEVIEFTKGSGAHLRTDGTVKTQDFTNWLQGFMVYGSDKKEFFSDPISADAIREKAKTNTDGFRYLVGHTKGTRMDASGNVVGRGEFNGERIMSPYGCFQLIEAESAEGVTVYDRDINPKYLENRPEGQYGKFFAWSDPIKAIV